MKSTGKEDQISLIEAGEVYKVESLFSHSLEQPKLEELQLYSYETLANATDDFEPKNELGKGGFGPVYKVHILSCMWCFLWLNTANVTVM